MAPAMQHEARVAPTLFQDHSPCAGAGARARAGFGVPAGRAIEAIA